MTKTYVLRHKALITNLYSNAKNLSFKATTVKAAHHQIWEKKAESWVDKLRTRSPGAKPWRKY